MNSCPVMHPLLLIVGRAFVITLAFVVTTVAGGYIYPHGYVKIIALGSACAAVATAYSTYEARYGGTSATVTPTILSAIIVFAVVFYVSLVILLNIRGA